MQLLAHRGVHQTFDRDGVTDETCTAERIRVPTHNYLENTIASMAAAFAAGASVVEIDIAKTTDDVLVVFHDWTLDCRTEATGPIRDRTWAELSTLDIGYGYTSDGTTYPFRDQGVGMLPTLRDVFATFPDGRFLINFKSGDITEATLLFELAKSEQAEGLVWAVYGAADTVDEYVEIADGRGFSERTVRNCMVELARVEVTADPPSACRNTVIALPLNLAATLPGWPETLSHQLAAVGTDLIIVEADLSGIDSPEALEALPDGLEAYVWTDRVELLTASE